MWLIFVLFDLFLPSIPYSGNSYYPNGTIKGPKPSSHIGLLVRYLFLPLWAPIYGRGWSENDYFYGKIASEYKAASRERQPTWKVSSAPYHIPIHGRAWLRAIFTLSRYLWHSVRMSLGICPAEPRNWKWPNGVGNSEMSIILCISITNNVKTCKKST